MKTALLIIHLVITMALMCFILLQSSKGGLGNAFGGEEFYRTKRGAERIVFGATIVLGVLFLTTSILNNVIH